MNRAVADVLKPPGTRSSRDRSRHRSSACHKLPLRAAPPGCARFRAPRRHATRASSTGFKALSRCAWRTRQRSGMPSRFGQHTRSTPADRGQWAGMPCHAPLNHSGGNRLGCVTLHPCCRVRARRTGRYRRGARKTEPAKPVLPCQGPFCFTGRTLVQRNSSVCITACSVFVRATRSEHQRSRERHIARCEQDAQEQNEEALCRNCDCQGITVEVLGKAGSILPLTDPDERRCTTMIAPRNPEVPPLRCVSSFPKKLKIPRKK